MATSRCVSGSVGDSESLHDVDGNLLPTAQATTKIKIKILKKKKTGATHHC